MRVLFVGAALLLSGGSASGQVVFSDTFDAENGGSGALNYTGFAKWSVSSGAVDLIGNGSNDFYPGNGLYVDLDGSVNDAGVMTSILIDLDIGQYELAFELGFNSAIGGPSEMAVSVGGFYSEQFTEANANAQTLTLITRTFDVTQAGQYSIVFDHAGGDNGGLVIDDVTLTLIPAPASAALLTASALGLVRRRRRA